jgi:hypothetical protein
MLHMNNRCADLRRTPIFAIKFVLQARIAYGTLSSLS